MSQSSEWIIIINLKSGKKHFRIQMNYLFKKLEEANIPYQHRITEFAGHATLIAKNYAQQGYLNFLVVGGDGTMSEVVNGIFSTGIQEDKRLKIAQIPRGTGNDWARFWNMTRDYKHAIEVFLAGKSIKIDMGKASFSLEGEAKNHFFINSIGFGLDAYVVNYTHRLKRYFGSHSFLYLLALLSAVFRFKSKTVKLSAQEQTIEGTLFTMNIANGCYSGGGMKQNPDAVPYDGLLDLMLAQQPTFKDILTALPLIFNGKLLEHPVIESFRSQKISLHTQNGRYFEADGIITYYAAPIEISIIPEAIEMVVPQGEHK